MVQEVQFIMMTTRWCQRTNSETSPTLHPHTGSFLSPSQLGLWLCKEGFSGCYSSGQMNHLNSNLHIEAISAKPSSDCT